jgi:hypothetical protein
MGFGEVCAIFSGGVLICCCVMIAFVFLAGEIVMVTLGSICLSNKDDPEKVAALCGSNDGALALVIIGSILLFFTCCGGGGYAKLRE